MPQNYKITYDVHLLCASISCVKVRFDFAWLGKVFKIVPTGLKKGLVRAPHG